MKSLKIALALAALLASSSAMAQRIKMKEGNLDMLKGVKKMNIKYDYSNMTCTTKDIPEAEFIANKKEEYNKKETGKGDHWAEGWVADRENRYAPKFREMFEKQSDITLDPSGNEKYTLIFHTTHTETGYNIGISRRNAYIDAEALVVESANPDKVLARITMDDIPGSSFGGYDFDTGARLSESYEKAGKSLGKYISKQAR
ncbi:MAG: hypothetical protein JST52_02570 [Bacteroidetes bacterium]|nr:hypothetical protein [Bacteroidota bacterium]MBS1740148.1 hypothetical protein [Bacteroidota bacterium]